MSKPSRRAVLTAAVAAPVFTLAPTDNGDAAIADHIEREMPGFWDYFIARHPEFKSPWSDKAPKCLWGRMDVHAIYEAQGETITAYVREFGR